MGFLPHKIKRPTRGQSPAELTNLPASAQPLTALLVRELTDEDEAALCTAPSPAPPPTLKSLRFSHHQLARLIAIDEAPARISLITGYAPSYIASIQHDPTFTALVEHYRSNRDELLVDIRARMRDLGLDSLLILQQRLHEEDLNPGSQKFSHRELMEAIKLLLVEPQGSTAAPAPHPVNVKIEFVKSLTPDSSKVIEGELIGEAQP